MTFIVVEARAKDPMIPLDLFRNRTFTVSVIATFFAVFGFSILIIFLPLWFQIVQGASTTASGYLLFPFLIGLIFSSVLAGQLVSRRGRYKMLLAVAIAFMGIGLALFINLRADTPNYALWSWMLITGLGVGPTMAIFTLIVQNDVPFVRLGTATSDLTLFRQIGTSVGLTVAFTLFRDNLSWGLLHDSIVSAMPAGAPSQVLPPSQAPAGFDPTATHRIGIYGSRNLTVWDMGTNYASTTFDFVPAGGKGAGDAMLVPAEAGQNQKPAIGQRFLPVRCETHFFQTAGRTNDDGLTAAQENAETFFFHRRMKTADDAAPGIAPACGLVVGGDDGVAGATGGTK